jgi:hypothetical protein
MGESTVKIQCFLLCSAALASACAPPVTPAPDASPDAALTPDATPLPDASPSPDATADAALDAALDAGTDGSLPDASGGACSQYQGNASWTARLVVEPGARLCAIPSRQWLGREGESDAQMRQRVLTEALARKGTITMPAGTYAIATANETRAFLLPMCVEDLSGARPVATAASSVSAVRFEGGIGRDDGFYVEAQLGLGAETRSVVVARPITSAVTATLSASPVASHAFGVTATRSNGSGYVSCALRATHCYNLTLPGLGTARVDEYRWAASPGQGQAVPLRLRGTLDGAAVDVRSYESMTGVYGHHAFDRAYFFRFASPVRGACGVRIDLNSDDTATGQLAACDASPMGASFAITAATAACD